MKIWRNDKRVVKDSGYTLCANCCMEYQSIDSPRYICLATHFNLKSADKLCTNGYKYEADV